MNITDILERLKIPCKRHGEHHHVTRGWVNTDCPWCSPNWGKYRLGWEIGTGRVACWQCGGKNAAAAIQRLSKLTFPEAIELWKSVDTRWKQLDTVSTGKLELPEGVGPLLPAHTKYLESRGFDPIEIERLWDVQGIGISSWLAWRIYIPIYDRNGRQVSWTTRAIGDDVTKRYMTAPPEKESLSHKSVLYGEHHAVNAVVVVEGPLDAWAIGPGAVATCGLSFTQEQADLIARYPIRVVCFDSDDSAQRRADRLCLQLSGFPGSTERVRLETGEDAASADKAEIQELRQTFLEPGD